jgi:hypothetical protein
MLTYNLLQVIMNPEGELSVPKGRGRGPWQEGLNRRELRRPQTEKRIGMKGTKFQSNCFAPFLGSMSMLLMYLPRI